MIKRTYFVKGWTEDKNKNKLHNFSGVKATSSLFSNHISVFRDIKQAQERSDEETYYVHFEEFKQI